ncbi:MAG: hypothetical protein LUE98_17335 [Tannerellaceae bacterium]|nr:hypothetical protein [Tannerellaceae bacterium]
MRIAIGSSRSELKGFMIREGLLLLAIIWLPAVFVCLNLGYSGALSSLLDLKFTWQEGLVAIVLTTIIMGIMIIAGILYPARQSATIQPAEALHYE